MKSQTLLDPHLQEVVEFMQACIPTSKLIAIAENLPQVARLLWNRFPQEPCLPLMLIPIKRDQVNPSQSTASESHLGYRCAGDDSAAAVGDR
jgi:hypothetical protein